MNGKARLTVGVLAAIVLGAVALLVSAVSGRDPLAFAGPHRVDLAHYRAADPTGVPSELRNADLIKRGEYLARAADCGACHTAAGGEPYAGGLAFATPFGSLYSTNITADRETGIGDYSDTDFLKALHQGTRRDGARLYPAMPFASFTYMTDPDALAIKAYLFSLKPVHAPSRANQLRFPFNQRLLMVGWSLLFSPDRRFEPNADRSAQWNRGAYLAEAMEHCGECHTPRNLLQGLNNRSKFAGNRVDDWRAYNITAHRDSGLGAWSDQDIAQYLSGGHAEGHGTAAGPMGAAVTMSLSHLTKDDVAALVAYVRTVPAIETSSLPPPKPRPPSGNAQDGAMATNLPGQAVFSRFCVVCHGANGVSELTPLATLTGSRAVNDTSGANAVQVIFFGEQDYQNVMPPLGAALSDEDIANVVNYVTGRLGVKASMLTPAAVAKVRADWARSQALAQPPAAETKPPDVASDADSKQAHSSSHWAHFPLSFGAAIFTTAPINLKRPADTR